MSVTVLPIGGIGEVLPGSDLPGLLIEASGNDGEAALRDGDVVIATQKIVSKAEDRFVDLREITPSAEAERLGARTAKDPRLVEVILREASDVVRASTGVLIVRHRLGMVMANAGIDQSNIGPGGGERVLLLPHDPDASAAAIRDAIATRTGTDVAVVISDSFGRPWRHGVVNIAIGAAGLASLVDERGKADRNGRLLGVTQVALADAVACAAGLVLGEAAEGIPAAIVRGVNLHRSQTSPASAILRPAEQDLFR